VIFFDNCGYEPVPGLDDFVEAAYALCGESHLFRRRRLGGLAGIRMAPSDMARYELNADIFDLKIKAIMDSAPRGVTLLSDYLFCQCACHKPGLHAVRGGCAHCTILG
jgi:hypothetical protein